MFAHVSCMSPCWWNVLQLWINKHCFTYKVCLGGVCAVCLINYDCYFGHCPLFNILQSHHFRKWFSLLTQATEEVDKVQKTNNTHFTIPVKESVTHCCQDIVLSFINLMVYKTVLWDAWGTCSVSAVKMCNFAVPRI